MQRTALTLALTLALPATGLAQIQSLKPQPITSRVKDAGVYHLATGTWSRGARASALAGPEVIYDNTCTVGYYFGMSDGDKVIDSGRIPSTNSPSTPSSRTGTADLYEVNGFTVGYCTYEPLVTNIEMSFIDCYAACDGNGIFPTPTKTLSLLNMPAGTVSGAQGCWIVTFDLANSTDVFRLGGDCNASYNNDASLDSFGWSWWQTIPTTGSDAGPIFAGDPSGLFPQSGQTCGGVGAGTTFVGAGPGPGTGIGLVDRMDLMDGPTVPGCRWFGGYGGSAGNPFTAFYLQVNGEGVPFDGGSSYCFGGGGAACPCGNTGSTGSGCANSSGGGAIMTVEGVPSIFTDTFSFNITGVNGSKPCLLIRGNNQAGGAMGVPAGDGLLCTTGGSQRSQVQMTDAGGTTTFSDWNGSGLGSVANAGAATNFQCWYRDPVGGPCGSGFNFSNGWTVTYIP